MKNIDYINYIENELAKNFSEIHLIKKTESQPNGGFKVIFKLFDCEIWFYKEKGFLEGGLLREGSFTPWHHFDKSLQNIWLENTDNIDIIINSLVKHKNAFYK